MWLANRHLEFCSTVLNYGEGCCLALYDDPSALFHVEHGAKVLRCWFQFFTQICEDLGMGSGGQLGRNVDRLVVFGDKHDTLLVEL